jgi:hypothetical protein
VETTHCIDAAIRQLQSLHWTAIHDVRRHNLFHIGRIYKAVPDRLRVDHHRRPVLALIQASRFIRAHLGAHTGFGQLLLEKSLEIAFPGRIARSPRMPLGPLVTTYKDVVQKLGHAQSYNSNCARMIFVIIATG